MEGLRNTRIAAVRARCCTDQLQAALQYIQNRTSDMRNVAKVGVGKCVYFRLYCSSFLFTSSGNRSIGLLLPAEQILCSDGDWLCTGPLEIGYVEDRWGLAMCRTDGDWLCAGPKEMGYVQD